jgi:hypothetical protein
MSSSKSGTPYRLLLRIAVFALVFGSLAEVWFRTAMPACQVPGNYQHQPATIYRCDPFGQSEGLYTVDRLCRKGGTWHVNAAGWNSDVNYVSAEQRHQPMVALIGDSYVAGYLTDTNQHIDAYLPGMLPGSTCYAFGIGGWYLEQYVAVSRYVSARFQPDVIVVFIDSADVSDSVRENGTPSPFWWQITRAGDVFKEMPPTAVYEPSPKLTLAKKSALVRYLRYNAKVPLPGVPNAVTPQQETGGDTTTGGGDGRQLLPAANFMVSRLCAEHPGTPLVFVAHSDRYLPMDEVAKTPLFADGRAVQAACRARPQCSFIDLRYAFSADWASHGTHFEAADGGHWNAYANRLVARTLAGLIIDKGLLDASQEGVGTQDLSTDRESRGIVVAGSAASP